MSERFWEKSLEELNQSEWEQLCDSCAQCCLVKLQDDSTGEIFTTDVVCAYLKIECGHCTVYAQRAVRKPDCFVIERGNREHLSWLPRSCAYRLRAEDKPLPQWHPLITGDRQAMIEAGIAVGGWCISEREVAEEELEERVIFSLLEEG